MGGSANLYGYAINDPVNHGDPSGLQVAMDAGILINPVAGEVNGAIADFKRNFDDMNRTRKQGGDKYFHCKANCEAAKRGSVGKATSKVLSELKEFKDQYWTGHPAADCDADRAANAQGRDADPSKSCKEACASLRPPGLDPKY